MSNIITSDDILAKEVIGPDGAILGTVIKLHIHKDNLQIVGVTIDKGFMKPDLFVGTDFIKRFGIDAVLLKHIPKETYEGLPVITLGGVNLGRVKEALMQNHIIRELIVTCKAGFFKTEEISVPIKKIKEIGLKVILKKGVKIK